MITIRRNVSSAGTRRSYGTRCALSWILHTRRSWRNVLQRLLMIPSRGNAIVMRCFEFHIDIPRGSNTGIPNCCRRDKFSKKYRKVKVVPTQINCKKCLFKKTIPGNLHSVSLTHHLYISPSLHRCTFSRETADIISKAY